MEGLSQVGLIRIDIKNPAQSGSAPRGRITSCDSGNMVC